MKTSYRVATVWGIPIRIHLSLLLMVLVLVLQFGLWNGILIEIGLAVSIVLHELGHSLMAMRAGCRVREITLMVIGGAARMERMPTRPRDELLMAVAGPAVSLILGLSGIFLGTRLPLRPTFPYGLNFLEFIGAINLSLLIFNLLPAFPMDGGRVFRALLTPRFGRLRATFIAVRLGKIMAIVFGIYGFSTQHWILVLIAFFVYGAGGNEYRMVQAREMGNPGYWAAPGDWDGDDDNRVLVGPPPYERGSSRETDIQDTLSYRQEDD